MIVEESGSKEISLQEAQRVIASSEQERQQRFHAAYQRLCAEFGLELAARPVFTDDGRVSVIVFVKNSKGS